jgi:hypothetical protein
MPKASSFYSISEEKKPPAGRVYHDNSACPPGRDIPVNEPPSGLEQLPALSRLRKIERSDPLARTVLDFTAHLIMKNGRRTRRFPDAGRGIHKGAPALLCAGYESIPPNMPPPLTFFSPDLANPRPDFPPAAFANPRPHQPSRLSIRPPYISA